MSTRITNSMVSSQVLGDIQDISNRLSKTQLKLASGKEITKPSDDPYAASRALTLSNSLEGIKQFQRNANDASSWMSVTDTALSSINDAAQRARELLVQAGNDTNSTTSRTAIADEIDQLIDSMKGDANAQVDGRYVLAGTATATAPYTVGGADTYAGDGNAVYRTIGPNVSVQINTLGSTILGSGVSGDGGLIGVLRDISTHLRAARSPPATRCAPPISRRSTPAWTRSPSRARWSAPPPTGSPAPRAACPKLSNPPQVFSQTRRTPIWHRR